MSLVNNFKSLWRHKTKKTNYCSFLLFFPFISTAEHPIAKLVQQLQCRVYSRLYLFISKDWSQEFSSSSAPDHRSSLPVEAAALADAGASKLKTSQSLYCLHSCHRPSIQHSYSIGEKLESFEYSADQRTDKEQSNKEMESSFEDLEHFLSPTSLSAPAALQKLSTLQYLNTVVKDIHNARGKWRKSQGWSGMGKGVASQ